MNDTITIGSDLTVRRMGFGAMRVTGEGIWGPPPDRNAAVALLRRAVELGIDFIDTADSYGPNVSEEIIGEALAPYGDGVVIATKGGLERDGPGIWRANCRPEHLRKALEGSLRRLDVERIDLHQLHTIDRDVPLEESLGELSGLQREGKIRHIGVSNFSAEELKRARKAVDVVSVQNRYNLSYRASDDIVDACEEAGIAFLPWHPLAAADLLESAALQEVAADHDATVAQVCLAWLLHRSPVIIPIPGTSSIAHLEENTAAREVELTSQDLQRIEDAAAS